MNKESIIYKKHNSFFNFRDKKQIEEQECLKGISKLIKDKNFSNILTDLNGGQILEKITFDLFSLEKTKNKPFFKLTPNVITEISKIADDRLLEYLIHRYRYEIYPETKKLDKYPPYVQIEPSSIYKGYPDPEIFAPLLKSTKLYFSDNEI